jgi:hypothetical protein
MSASTITEDRTLKIDKHGDVKWHGLGTVSGERGGYALELAGSTRLRFRSSQEWLRVVPSAAGQGWHVVIENEVVSSHRLKADAQAEALTWVR